MSIRPTLIVEAIEEDLTCQPGRIGTEEESWFEVFKGGVLWPTRLVRRLLSSFQRTTKPSIQAHGIRLSPSKQHNNTYITGPRKRRQERNRYGFSRRAADG